MSDKLPTDLPTGATASEVAIFTWDTFLAINAATTDGTGTLWKNYKEVYDIFFTMLKLLLLGKTELRKLNNL